MVVDIERQERDDIDRKAWKESPVFLPASQRPEGKADGVSDLGLSLIHIYVQTIRPHNGRHLPGSKLPCAHIRIFIDYSPCIYASQILYTDSPRRVKRRKRAPICRGRQKEKAEIIRLKKKIQRTKPETRRANRPSCKKAPSPCTPFCIVRLSDDDFIAARSVGYEPDRRADPRFDELHIAPRVLRQILVLSDASRIAHPAR